MYIQLLWVSAFPFTFLALQLPTSIACSVVVCSPANTICAMVSRSSTLVEEQGRSVAFLRESIMRVAIMEMKITLELFYFRVRVRMNGWLVVFS